LKGLGKEDASATNLSNFTSGFFSPAILYREKLELPRMSLEIGGFKIPPARVILKG
jgi:hypothetical protein